MRGNYSLLALCSEIAEHHLSFLKYRSFIFTLSYLQEGTIVCRMKEKENYIRSKEKVVL